MNRNDIIAFLEGKTNELQSWKVRQWIRDPKNEKIVHEILTEVWTHSTIEIQDNKPDFESMLNQVHHLINLNEKQHSSATKTIHFKKIFHKVSQIAAILIVPILMALGFYIYKDAHSINEQDITATQTIVTKPGSRMKLELSDGTIVWLNDGTTFKYPTHFSKNERRVYVDGEAYFEVATNAKRPFIVENKMLNTRVTGTKFNINAYTADNYFEATLLEGKVILEKGNQTFEMKPGFQVQMNAEMNKITNQQVNADIATAWIHGKLILENEPLEIAVKKLSRWYNMEIIIKSSELNDYFLTATIEDEKPEQTIKLISYALPIRYEIKTTKVNQDVKRTVYLMKK